MLLFEINFPSPPIPAWLTRGGGGTKIGQKGTDVCRITYAGAWPKFRKHVRKLRGDRSGIIGVLDRLSRRHRAMRSNRVSGGVDRDKLGFRSCQVGRSIDGFAVVKLVRWTWERLIAGRGYDYGRMKFVVELYTAFRNILGWNLALGKSKLAVVTIWFFSPKSVIRSIFRNWRKKLVGKIIVDKWIYIEKFADRVKDRRAIEYVIKYQRHFDQNLVRCV